MGGCPDPDLESHRRDDRVYQRERRALKKYLPKLVDHLGEMRLRGESDSDSYAVLFALCQQLTNSVVRVPMHVLMRGADVLKREVLNKNQEEEPNESILDVVWRSSGFRAAVTQRMADAINTQIGDDESCTKTVTEAAAAPGLETAPEASRLEEIIFMRARDRREYLENAARVIVFHNRSSKRPSTKRLIRKGLVAK